MGEIGQTGGVEAVTLTMSELNSQSDETKFVVILSHLQQIQLTVVQNERNTARLLTELSNIREKTNENAVTIKELKEHDLKRIWETIDSHRESLTQIDYRSLLRKLDDNETKLKTLTDMIESPRKQLRKILWGLLSLLTIGLSFFLIDAAIEKLFKENTQPQIEQKN